MDARAAEEIRLLQDAGALRPGCSVVDIGAGSGQFALAAARVCERVVAVDVSPVMLARLGEKLGRDGASNVEAVAAGFLTYRHSGEPADVVYGRFALHHLPDFWKAIALSRIAGVLRPGGVLRLWDVVYGFEPTIERTGFEMIDAAQRLGLVRPLPVSKAVSTRRALSGARGPAGCRA